MLLQYVLYTRLMQGLGSLFGIERAGAVDPVGFYGGFTPCSVDTLLDDERNTPAVGAVKNRYKTTGMRNVAKPVKKIYIQWLFVLFS